MARSTKMPAQRKFSLAVQVPLLDADARTDRPAVALYAYSTGGALLASAPVDEKGQATLDFAVGTAATGLRLLAGPLTDEKQPEIDALLRRGAVERHLRLETDAERLQLDLPLAFDIWHPWLASRCLVKGTLKKRVLRDGITIDLPVCLATVEIYEVDPVHVLIPRLPRDLLERLREVIVQPIPLPDPIPDWLPDSGGSIPFPQPGPGPLPIARRSLPQPPAPMALQLAAAGGSELAFRQSLIDHATLVRPLLCGLHPQLVTMQRIGTAFTDDCGHFRTSIFKSIFNPDQPDLYFRATQRLFGFFDVTILAPTPIACHTWWNYVCGSEVSLFTSHPLAITCAPCPPIVAGNNWVLFMAIGNHPLSLIHGSGAALGATTPANRGLTSTGAPWGGTLRPRLEFDNALRDTLGVRYYRLSWKREAEPDSAYKPLNSAISRHYAHMVGSDLVLDAYPLGPHTVGSEGGLFEIPPAIPPAGQWSLPDVVEDTASGKFDTVVADGGALMDGQVQLRVELFDAAGLPVDTAALGIRYVVPTSTVLTGTVHTVDASTLGLVAGSTMVLPLHVNNEACSAAIAPPAIGASVADPCCGVLRYGSTGAPVSLAWTASHPHGFARHDFSVVRGVSSVYAQSDVPVGAGSFSATPTVDNLLNTNLPAGCAVGGCPVAGFSENLHVKASATNGWSRQSQYDAGAVRAFVLAAS